MNGSKCSLSLPGTWLIDFSCQAFEKRDWSEEWARLKLLVFEKGTSRWSFACFLNRFYWGFLKIKTHSLSIGKVSSPECAGKAGKRPEGRSGRVLVLASCRVGWMVGVCPAQLVGREERQWGTKASCLGRDCETWALGEIRFLDFVTLPASLIDSIWAVPGRCFPKGWTFVAEQVETELPIKMWYFPLGF